MKVCEACGREFKDDVVFCPRDGHPLMTKPEVKVPDADPLVGTVLDEKYRLDKKIGEGGMGAVYRATHVHMDAAVAVKLLHKSMVADAQAVERFRREARAAARIRHTHAVSVTDFGVTKEGTVYLVMEYLEGYDLREKLRKVKSLSPEETVRIMTQTCAAIEEAHRKGIVHRDLKPDNIWLLKREGSVEQEHVKVLDFGIAKLKIQGAASNLTQEGMIVGTPHYMSPEQCRGEELDARSDIYSLGVILYEMLTGDVPFRGPTPVSVVLKHANELPKPLRTIKPDVPEALEAVVMKSLEKNRDARQGSAAELAAELSTAIHPNATMSMTSGSRTPSIGVPGAFTTGIQAGGQGTGPATIQHTQGHRTPVTGDHHAPSTPSSLTGIPAQGATQFVGSELSLSPDRTVRTTATPVPSPSNARLYTVIAIVGAVIVAAVAALAVYVIRNVGPGPGPGPGPQVTNTNKSSAPTVPDGMVLIKGGTFKMGNDHPDPYYTESAPAHDVEVKDFYLDVYEVTNEQYAQFVKKTGRQPPDGWKGGDYPPGEGQFPVTAVSWVDAKAYSDWAGKRLPSEAEWEFAARAGGDRLYPWGNEWSPRLSNSKEDGRSKPMPVGSYPGGVSPFGVFDTAGNVAEWVNDDYAPYPGAPASVRPDPGKKIYRGGAFNLSKDDLVLTNRFWDFPTKKDKYIGFRCAQDVPPDAGK